MPSSYENIIDDVLDEIGEEDKLANVSIASMQGYILQACQQISQRLPIRDQTELRIIYGVTKYNFNNSTLPVIGTGTIDVVGLTVTGTTAAGTGTISTVGRDVTGVSTLFLSELVVGRMLIVGTEKVTVLAITSDTTCAIDGNFASDLDSSAFNYSTTRFTREVNVGSVIVSNGISNTIKVITDGYNMTVTDVYAAPQSSQAFTIDTKVTEIPTRFSQIDKCNRLEGEIPRPVRVCPYEKLTRQKNTDWAQTVYSNLDQPYLIAEWNQSGQRYMETYPPVETDKQVTIFGYIKINPRDYATALPTDSVPLPQDYEPMIKEYVKYRLYKKIKDDKSAAESFGFYENYMGQYSRNIPTTREVTVDYI